MTQSKEYLQDLYSEIYDVRQKRAKITSPQSFEYIIPKGKYYDDIPKIIQRHIKDTLDSYYLYTLWIGELVVRVFWVAYTAATADEIAQIYHWMIIAHKYAQCKPAAGATVAATTRIDIYLYMTNLHKQLPRTNRYIISAEHVNSAFTHSCPGAVGEINIYRYEEWFKVLIHETFHIFGMDFSGSEKLHVLARNEIAAIFPVKSDIVLYEAYTEFMAEIIARMFYTRDFRAFEIQMKREQAYSAFQVCKILRFMGLEYCDLFGTTEHCILARRNYCENTPVLSYYIIKSIMIIHLDDCIECFLWEDVIHNIWFVKTKKAILSFCEFIRKYHNSDKMEKYMDMAEKGLNDSNGYDTIELRMTAPI
jgi:hypothetical protein